MTPLQTGPYSERKTQQKCSAQSFHSSICKIDTFGNENPFIDRLFYLRCSTASSGNTIFITLHNLWDWLMLKEKHVDEIAVLRSLEKLHFDWPKEGKLIIEDNRNRTKTTRKLLEIAPPPPSPPPPQENPHTSL